MALHWGPTRWTFVCATARPATRAARTERLGRRLTLPRRPGPAERTPARTARGALVTFAIKAARPVALGGRELPRWFTGMVVLLAPAPLTALMVTQVLADGKQLSPAWWWRPV
jgi:hypothetical protein